MAILTSGPFGAARFTKDDAQKFKAQMTYGRAKKEAAVTYTRGKNIAAEYASKGYAVLKNSADV